jgi:hypothetical protein
MADDDDKQRITDAFLQGRLSTFQGDFIPCDYCASAFLLPFLLMAYVCPILILLLSLVQTILDPSGLISVYQRIIESDLATNLVGAALALFVIVVGGGMFIAGIMPFWFTILSLSEWERERRTQEYRYGLLLTDRYFALRCFSESYQKSPFILSREQISGFALRSERGEKVTRWFIVIEIKEADGTISAMRPPTTDLDTDTHKLHRQLVAWLSSTSSSKRFG